VSTVNAILICIKQYNTKDKILFYLRNRKTITSWLGIDHTKKLSWTYVFSGLFEIMFL